jgi:ribose transport system substrate-binding protein
MLAGCKQQSSKPQIAVIPKGTTHEYWKAVKAGADQAGKELDVDIIWKGPLKEDDRAGQIQVVQEFVADRVSGIVLAPLDQDALLSPVQAATQQNIPVVIIDSGLKGAPGKDFASFVATDNHKGGQIGGEELARILKGKGKVVLLRYAIGSASTEERENGFLDAMKAHPDIQVISSDRYGQATVDSAKSAALNMLDTIKQADGIFCPNESTTQGMLLALQEAGLAGKVKFVGFDETPALVEALKKGEIEALVAQDPFKMGYTGVKTLMHHIKGEKVPETIDTGVALVTRENLESPDIQKLLSH